MSIELMTQHEREIFFQRLQTALPTPRTELQYTNAYTLLVAVVLSAQATDISVNKATEKLFLIADTPEKMVQVGEEPLKSYIRSIGLYHTKAKNVIKLSQDLILRYNGIVPGTLEDLQSLAGVGRKTANVVLNVYFNQPTIAVDTHIFRVSNRTGLAPGKTPLAVEQALLERVPQQWLYNAHHWLILHGRYTCIARKPKCFVCPVADVCHFPEKTALP